MNFSSSKNFKVDLLFLEGLRGIAALIVLIGHARWLLWEGYSMYLKHPEQYSLLNKLMMYFFSFFKFGHYAVLFFFILSGFVIHLRNANNLNENRDNFNFSFLEYFLKRVKRIYPPLITSIVLTFLFDSFGIFLELPIYFSKTSNELINRNITIDHSFTTLFGNLFFLMNTYNPVWGSNGPLWSLKFEWWFYMFYPFFLRVRIKSSTLAFTLLLIFFVLSIYRLLPLELLNDVFYYMILWWLGAVLADVYVNNLKLKTKHFIFLIIFLIVPLFYNKYQEHFISLGLTGFLSLLLYLKQIKFTLLIYLNKLSFLGSFSYTLYIIHFPILVFISGLILKNNNNQFSLGFNYVILGIIVSLLASYLLSNKIEKPFITKYETKD